MSFHVTQIFISEADEALPPPLAACTRSVQSLLGGANYRLYTGETLRDFIASHYGGDVLRAYDRLKPFAYKADLGRYCILHELGGWYADLPTRLAAPLAINAEVRAIVFRDFNLTLPYGWGVANGFFYAAARAPFLATAIELVLANCRNKDYGATPFSMTGPALFGRALALAGEDAGFIYGDRMPLTPTHRQKNFAFVMPDGAILAWAKQLGNGGDLTPYGMTGANNYIAMWKARDVFNEG